MLESDWAQEWGEVSLVRLASRIDAHALQQLGRTELEDKSGVLAEEKGRQDKRRPAYPRAPRRIPRRTWAELIAPDDP